jgi:hypothetical protein
MTLKRVSSCSVKALSSQDREAPQRKKMKKDGTHESEKIHETLSVFIFQTGFIGRKKDGPAATSPSSPYYAARGGRCLLQSLEQAMMQKPDNEQTFDPRTTLLACCIRVRRFPKSRFVHFFRHDRVGGRSRRTPLLERTWRRTGRIESRQGEERS